MSSLLVLLDASGSITVPTHASLIITQMTSILARLSQHGAFDVLVFDDRPRLLQHVEQNDAASLSLVNANLLLPGGGGDPQRALDAYPNDWDYLIILTDGKLLSLPAAIDRYVLLGSDIYLAPGIPTPYQPAPGSESALADLLWADFMSALPSPQL